MPEPQSSVSEANAFAPSPPEEPPKGHNPTQDKPVEGGPRRLLPPGEGTGDRAGWGDAAEPTSTISAPGRCSGCSSRAPAAVWGRTGGRSGAGGHFHIDKTQNDADF